MNEYEPDYVSPPGETLAELLENSPLSPKKLNDILMTEIEGLIDGSTTITEEIAMKLDESLGTPAEFWLNRQRHYDEAKKRNGEES